MQPGLKNFVTDIIDADLAVDKHGGRVHTRFPPEPNGYLHIGHAKSICLNFGLARQYSGQCNLRFDDTNPTTEDTEYVDSIQSDVRWLGFKWDGEVRYASDYFEQFYAWAERLIEDGKAYVDEQTVDEIREHRGSAQEPGRNSPDRDRPAGESLDLLRRMRAGEFPDGQMVLRAKVDMAHPNILMRDPLIYRIRKAHHHRTGDEWCIYPMYDYAHCLEDAIEGITHSVCTLEFDNNRDLYDWFLDNLPVPYRPHQYEMSRLDLSYTVMSKRWLLKLVEEGHVGGWDDPRMPTLAGLRRRGIPPEAIRAFCADVGVTKSKAVTDPALLDFHIREVLNHQAPRVMVVQDPLPVTVTNLPEDHELWLDASLWPHDVPKEGTRSLPLSRNLVIERSDFAEDPPKGFKRLVPGGLVRLRHGEIIRCDRLLRGSEGALLGLECSLCPADEGAKPKGTIHWLSADHAQPLELQLVDRLFSVPQPGATEGIDLVDELNPQGLVVKAGGLMEPFLAQAEPGQRFQFERQGYFIKDSKNAPDGTPRFIRVVELRDSWGKQQAKEPEPVSQKARDGAAKKQSTDEPVRLAERSDALRARMEALPEEFGLAAHDAERLTRQVEDLQRFEAGVAAGADPGDLATLLLNDLPAGAELPADHLAGLLKLEAAGRLRRNQRSQVIQAMLESGRNAAEAGTELGFLDASPVDATTIVQKVLASQPEELARYRGGEQKLMGFFMGAVMRAAKGAADPQALRDELKRALDGS